MGANYGASEGPNSCMPLDWGALVPLWFFVESSPEKSKIVIVTPSRELSFETLINFGSVIAKTVESSGKKVVFVASADQGHAHSANGPYGFHPASVKFDELVKLAVLKNNLKPLFSMPQRFIEDAKPDSLWQLAMLQGILEHVPMKARLVSYQVPTYFGMLCAAYFPFKASLKKDVDGFNDRHR